MVAVAQKRFMYIYDNTGAEVHCLREHIEVNALEFLPYHFLLVSVVCMYVCMYLCMCVYVCVCM